MKPLPAQLHLPLVTAKFGLTALVAVLLAGWLVPKDVLSAAFVALLCIQPSLVTGIKAGIEQVLASGLGAVSTIGFLLVFPITPFTTGASIATTYAVAAYMRMSYPALVVALFSSLYMTLLAQHTPFDTVLLRFQSVLLGVGVAIAINAVFSPISTTVNLTVRLERAVETVRAQLASLRQALLTLDAAALDRQLATFQDAFRSLGLVKDDMADMRREMRLPGRPGRRGLGEVYFSDRCLRELELTTHHAQDVVMACKQLLQEAPPAESHKAASDAAEAVQGGLDVLALVQSGHWDRAAALSDECRAHLHALTEDAGGPHGPLTPQYSPRLVLAFALIQLHAHLGELVAAAGWLEQARKDPDEALRLAAIGPKGPGGPPNPSGETHALGR